MDIAMLLLIAATIIFGIAAWVGKNLVALGLAFWSFSEWVHRL